MITDDEADACTCNPDVIVPTPSMVARGFTEWLHHASGCAVTVARQQPITVTTDGGGSS